MGRRTALAIAALGLALVVYLVLSTQGRDGSAGAHPIELAEDAATSGASLAQAASTAEPATSERRAEAGREPNADLDAERSLDQPPSELHRLTIRLFRGSFPPSLPRKPPNESEPIAPPDVRFELRELSVSGDPRSVGGLLAEHGGAVPVSSASHLGRVLGEQPDPGPWREMEPDSEGSLHLSTGSWELRPAPDALFAFQDGAALVVHVPTLTELLVPAYELARVRGVLVDANGHGVSGRIVVPDRMPRLFNDDNRTAPDGSFAFRALAGDVTLAVRDTSPVIEEHCTLLPYQERWIELLLSTPEVPATSTNLVLRIEGSAPELDVRLVQAPHRMTGGPDTVLEQQFRVYGNVQPTDPTARPPYAWTHYEAPVTTFEGLQPMPHLVIVREVDPDTTRPPIPLGLVELDEGQVTRATMIYEPLSGPRLRGYVRGPVQAWSGTVGLFPVDSPLTRDPDIRSSALPFDLVPPKPGRWLLAARIHTNCVWYAEEVTIGPGQVLEHDLRLPTGSLELWPEGPTPAGDDSHLVLHRLADGLDELPYRRVTCRHGRWRFDLLPTGTYRVAPEAATEWEFGPLPTFEVQDGELTTARIPVLRRIEANAR